MKCVRANRVDVGRNDYRCEIPTVLESARVYHAYLIRYVNLSQHLTIVESCISDYPNRLRQRNSRQRVTIVECIIPNAGDALTKIDAP